MCSVKTECWLQKFWKSLRLDSMAKKCAARWQTVLKTHALPHLWQSRFPNGFWELVPVARNYIATSFDLHRDSTRRLIVTSRVSGRKRRVSLCSQAVTGVTSTAAWRTGARRTKSLVSIFTRFQSSCLRLTLATRWLRGVVRQCWGTANTLCQSHVVEESFDSPRVCTCRSNCFLSFLSLHLPCPALFFKQQPVLIEKSPTSAD